MYKQKTFTRLFFIWLLTLNLLLFFTTKKESFLFINRHHNTFFDIFFTILTSMGDGLFIIALAVILFLFKYKKLALGLFISFLFSGLVAQIIKKLGNAPRPTGYFSDASLIHSVPWFSMHKIGSFPSGHTTSIFAAAIMISLFSRSKRLTILSFVIACLVAYSRVYLGQHFVEDVLAGSVLGFSIGTFCFYWQERLLAKSYLKYDFGK